MKPQPQAADWSRAKSLLESLRAHTRLSLAAQILIGKELSGLKSKLGFARGFNQGGPVGQFGRPVDSWEKQCQENLGIPQRTADRWIECFKAAVERAKRHKKNRPEAFRLLQTPAAELTGEELDQLADHVEKLVTHSTQQDLLEELGFVKPIPTVGGDTSKHRKKRPNEYYLQEMFDFITCGISEVVDQFKRTREGISYLERLEKIPFRSSDPDAPSLERMKRELDHLIRDELKPVLKEVEEAIQRKKNAAKLYEINARTTKLK